MARPPGADDEYAELQKRFQMLENDRKTLFEHTQLEVKKNKDSLAKLKKENKDLRSSLSSLMGDHGKSNGKDSEIGKLEQQVQELRRRHDDVRHQCSFRQKELDGMRDRLADLEKEMTKLNDDDTPLTRNIRTLENRLDKAMIKYNEAQSIRKTYEQIVKRLKEERWRPPPRTNRTRRVPHPVLIGHAASPRRDAAPVRAEGEYGGRDERRGGGG
jgi:chromosome segregation ATPase